MSETDKLQKQFRKDILPHKARLIAMLLKKGLKANWSQEHFIDFISVMAGLHAQTKDWKFPSSNLYMSLDPQSLTTLVLWLEERKST